MARVAGGCFYEYWDHIQEFSGIDLNGLEDDAYKAFENKAGPVIRVGSDYGALAVSMASVSIPELLFAP